MGKVKKNKMKHIILISCVSQKLTIKSKAKDLYISTLFKKNLEYALSLNPSQIFILSAKYGLVELDETIEPYDKTLNNMSSFEKKEWAELVVNKLRKLTDLRKDKFTFLAGNNYRKYLIPHLKFYEIPMNGLPIGKQLQWLTENTKKKNHCLTLHKWFDQCKKYSFPFDKNKIPENGIYILFEKGESGHSTNKIVRIGCHTGANQLPSRLTQHFLNENKDRSIFRKNIGRAILKKENDSFLEKWEIDLTPREAREKHSKSIDFEKQKSIEKKVTKYIQENFFFTIIPIEDKKERLYLEAKIISTVSLCSECFPSKNWLGNYSPKEKIRQSGLWQVNELWKTPLSDLDMNQLKQIIKQNE